MTAMAAPTIRTSRLHELPLLSALEKAGDVHFRAVGMDRVADSPAPEPSVYEAAHHAGRLLVAVDHRDRPIGFVRVELVDTVPHVEQVSVHPDRAGWGIGAALLAAAEDWARARAHDRITLTTFRDVAWDGPYYTRLGWRLLPEALWGPELTDVRLHERALGLDEWPRQAMVKRL